MNEEMLTVAEAAERIGVHHQTIRNYIRAGYLPATRVGKKSIRISTSDLDAIMQPVEVNER